MIEGIINGIAFILIVSNGVFLAKTHRIERENKHLRDQIDTLSLLNAKEKAYSKSRDLQVTDLVKENADLKLALPASKEFEDQLLAAATALLPSERLQFLQIYWDHQLRNTDFKR